MIWGLALAAILAFAVAFTTHSPLLLGFCLAIGFGCGIAAALIFIERHVRASSRPEHMTARELEALRTTLRKDAQPPAETPRELPPSEPPQH